MFANNHDYGKGTNMFKTIIIDDNKVLADTLASQAIWIRNNFEVVAVCYDSLSGINAINQHKPDLIVTDIRLPGIDGLRMIQSVHKVVPHVLIVVISAYNDFLYAQRALRLGVLDYLLKPFSQEEMQNVLNKAIKLLKEKDDIKSDVAPSLVEPILLWMENHLEQRITAEMVAREFYMSTSRLNKLMRKYYNKGFREIYMDLRMKKAKELLNDVRNSVSDVAIRIGFQSYASFYRAFVRINSISPSQYRDLMQDQSKEFYENTH